MIPQRLSLLTLLSLFLTLFGVFNQSIAADLWVTAYYPGTAEKIMPASEIDFAVITHVIQFALVPNADGTLDERVNVVARTNVTDLVQRAHATDRKVLICVGGANSAAGFQGATSPSHRAAFVSKLVGFMNAGKYDGIDVDWEPLTTSEFRQFSDFILDLRAAMGTSPTHKLLTAAVSAYPAYGDPPASEYSLFARLQSHFDQINIMTYDLSGAYAGWVTWFNSPIYDGGARFSSTGRPLPSVDGAVQNFITNGVARSKLGIGVAFYGDVWTGGVSKPRQSWLSPPSVTQIPFSEIMSEYYRSNYYHWDTNAHAAYLSIEKPGAVADLFVSYDDEHTCTAKVSYARQHGLGGLMIWQLAQDHRPDLSVDHRDPLVEAIRHAISSKSQ